MKLCQFSAVQLLFSNALLSTILKSKTLSIGIDFRDDNVSIVCLNVSRNSISLEQALSFAITSSPELNAHRLLGELNQLISYFPHYKINLVSNLRLSQVLTKVLSINSALSKTDVYQYIFNKVSRVQGYTDAGFVIAYTELGKNNKRSQETDYYLAVGKQREIDIKQNALAGIPHDKKLLDINSLALLRAIWHSKYQPMIEASWWLCVDVSTSFVTIVVMNGTQMVVEKEYNLDIVPNTLTNKNPEQESLKQVFQIIMQLVIRVNIPQSYPIFLCASFQWLTQYENDFLSQPTLKLAKVIPINLQLNQKKQNTDKQQSLANSNLITAYGLAMKGANKIPKDLALLT